MQEVKSYLKTSQMPKTLNLAQRQKLARMVEPFTLKEGTMYKMGQNNKMRRCLTTSNAQIILKELHEGVVGGHFAADITTKKILDAHYWWPTLFKDIHEFQKNCDNYQKIGGLKTKNVAKLVITLQEEPFMKWDLYFISPIKLVRRLTRNNHILVATDYATKWVCKGT